MRKKILNVPIDTYNFRDTLIKINELIKSGKSHQIATVNSEFIMDAQKNKEFMKVLNSTSISTPDGAGELFALRFLYGIKMKERVTGVDMFWALCKLAEDKHYRIFMLGAEPGVADEAAERIKLLHPYCEIVGTYPGSPFETDKIIRMINQAKPHLLFVAWGAPKQDIWIYKNLKRFNYPIVAMGVGGTYDFIVGKQVRAPFWMQKYHLEWLYRLIKEPKRYKRIYIAVIKFPLAVFKSKLISRLKPGKSV